MDNFKSAEEAARFWMEQANNYKTQLEAVSREYAEFVEGSKALENELELDLQQNVAKNRDLNACVIRLKNENEGLRHRVEVQNQNELRQQTESSQEITALRKQLEELKRQIRQLEQNNDDLEKRNRAAQASIDDLDAKINGIIERNAMLESELDEKEQLKILAQRFRDESRDLRSELQVIRQQAQTQPPQDSNRTEIQVPPAARVRSNPISIVNDLLRKVGVIENKLAAAACHRREDQPSKRKVFPASLHTTTTPEPRISFTSTATGVVGVGTSPVSMSNHTAPAMTPFYVDKKDGDSRRSPFCCFSVI